MANIQRTLWLSNTQEANSTIRTIPGGTPVLKGVFPIFWPRDEAGVFGQGQTVVEFRVRTSEGHDESTADFDTYTAHGIKLTLGAIKDAHTRYIEVNCSGTVGVDELSVILEAWPTQATRLEAVEALTKDATKTTKGVTKQMVKLAAADDNQKWIDAMIASGQMSAT